MGRTWEKETTLGVKESRGCRAFLRRQSTALLTAKRCVSTQNIVHAFHASTICEIFHKRLESAWMAGPGSFSASGPKCRSAQPSPFLTAHTLPTPATANDHISKRKMETKRLPQWRRGAEIFIETLHRPKNFRNLPSFHSSAPPQEIIFRFAASIASLDQKM